MRKTKRSYLFAVIILLVFGLGMSAGTLLVFYVFPVSILTCRYVETEQVDCNLQERMMGLIPIHEISIGNLKKAYIVTEIHERQEDDTEVEVARMLLSSNSGSVALESFDEFGGSFVQQGVNKINNFLLTPTDEPLRIWQATWVPLFVSSFFFLVSLIMLYAAVDILVRGVTGKIR